MAVGIKYTIMGDIFYVSVSKSCLKVTETSSIEKFKSIAKMCD